MYRVMGLGATHNRTEEVHSNMSAVGDDLAYLGCIVV